MGGDNTVITSNGDISVSTLAHELGHNFGFGHSEAIDCGIKAIDEFGNCQIKYYGDFTVMGHYPYLDNGYFRAFTGWLEPNDIEYVKTNGIYILNSLNSTTGKKLLVLPRPKSGNYYYLDYRQAVGSFDKNLTSGYTNGAVIRIGTHNLINSGFFAEVKSYLIDTTPETKSYYIEDPALTDGKIFNDDIENIQIKQISHDSSSVTLQISIIDSSYPNLSDAKGNIKVASFLYKGVFDIIYGQRTFDGKINIFDIASQIMNTNE